MMHAMRQSFRWLLGAAALLLMPAAASAQFYDLDGVYRCLTVPDAACEEALREHVEPPPAPPPPPPAPTLDQAIAKVRSRSADEGDIKVLETRAAANDGRAIEVLAWCRLNGIGVKRAPIDAYWLYRHAADLGVPHARANQIAVYKTRLTPEQRQQVLIRENAKPK
jgi:TPR repeat protein